jgi:hypothetical protein
MACVRAWPASEHGVAYGAACHGSRRWCCVRCIMPCDHEGWCRARNIHGHGVRCAIRNTTYFFRSTERDAKHSLDLARGVRCGRMGGQRKSIRSSEYSREPGRCWSGSYTWQLVGRIYCGRAGPPPPAAWTRAAAPPPLTRRIGTKRPAAQNAARSNSQVERLTMAKSSRTGE